MELKTISFFEFGPFRLEPSEHRLKRDGQAISLAPKAFELLVLLVENDGRLVSKDQIMRALWPSSFVEEANLTVAISVLRKALGRGADGSQYIETVPKKGYRFAAAVKQSVSAESITEPSELSKRDGSLLTSNLHPKLVLPEPSRRLGLQNRWVVLAAVMLAFLLSTAGYFVYRNTAVPAFHEKVQHSLAILPLRNLKHDRDIDFLGFSLADAVITKLGSVSSLTVRSSSAVEKYRERSTDLARTAEDLHVDTLLTGSFLREGDELRITYQLIDIRTDRILGRDTIDLRYNKLFTVQDKFAQEIIKALQLHLSPADAAQIKLNEPADPLAYEYYLRGVDLMGRHEFLLANSMLEKSAERDPSYALTWAYLGQSYNSTAAFQFGGRERYSKARAAYMRALALEPKQLEATMFLANLLIDTGKVEEAVPMLREILKRSQQNAALHWELGYAYRFAGMLEESAAACELAQRIDPSVKGNGSVLNTYLYLGEYEKFLQSLPDMNDSAFVLFYRGFGEYHMKHWDRAAQFFEHAYHLDPSLYGQIGLALSDGLAHRDREGLTILRALDQKIQQRGVGDPEAAYKIAQSYAALHDNASAMRALEYSIRNGFFAYPYLIADPLLESVRGDAQWMPLMNMARQRYEAFKQRFF